MQVLTRCLHLASGENFAFIRFVCVYISVIILPGNGMICLHCSYVSWKTKYKKTFPNSMSSAVGLDLLAFERLALNNWIWCKHWSHDSCPREKRLKVSGNDITHHSIRLWSVLLCDDDFYILGVCGSIVFFVYMCEVCFWIRLASELVDKYDLIH